MEQLETEDNNIESESHNKPNKPIACVIMIIGGFSRLLFWVNRYIHSNFFLLFLICL